VRAFELRTGRAVGPGALLHAGAPLASLALSQSAQGGLAERRLALLDTSGDLWLTSLVRPAPLKLATLIEAVA
jgi:intraflagellar transport protein 80